MTLHASDGLQASAVIRSGFDDLSGIAYLVMIAGWYANDRDTLISIERKSESDVHYGAKMVSGHRHLLKVVAA